MIKKYLILILAVLLLISFFSPSSSGYLTRDEFVPSLEAIAPSVVYTKYCIVKGDTLSRIARVSGIEMETIMAINNLSEDSILRVGDYLNLPVSPHNYYRVKAGDTICSIAAAYGIDSKTLIKANPEITNPDLIEADDLIRIPAGHVRRQLTSATPSRSLRRLFSWPVLGTISSRYGWRKSGFHHGIDIACPMNTPIKAVAAGYVLSAGVKPVYGRTVILQHSDGSRTLYAHASKVLVRAGQEVKKGQVIALVGVSGRTTGPHLHFEIYVGDKNKNPINYLKR